MLTQHQVNDFRKQLHQMRARLDERADSVRSDACHGAGAEDAGGLSNAPVHLADLGSQEAGAVVNVGLAVNEATLRQEIDDALARLDNGTFGVCEGCRKPIALERLQAVPYSRLCIQCAETSEQENQS